mgnify:CR=1 FL=1
MRVEISMGKTIRENADSYYELAKKARKKLAGLGKGEQELRKKILAGKASATEKKVAHARKREKKWFEKFHWFFTSEGFLVIGGRDAKSNEVVVKKNAEKNDVYFHADIHGAPHVVLKTAGKKPGEKSLAESAVFAAVFSKAWDSQLAAVDVYSASPEQVSKSAPSGESIGTGAFMVYGERKWFRKTPLKFAVGAKKEADSFGLISGPLDAVKANSDFFVEIVFGALSKGDAGKMLKKRFEARFGVSVSLDEIVSLLPNGTMRLATP